MERTEWLEARRKGLGGSDIAAVCGLSRWGSPMKVYLEKIQAVDPADDNEFFYWGRAAERMLLERFQEDHSEFLVLGNEDVIIRRDFPWMLGTPDGFCYTPHGEGEHGHAVAGWEGKTASAYKKGEWDGTDIPQEYWLQAQWYMAVTNLSRWFLSVLIGGNDYREWEIEREPDAIAMMMKRGEEFWVNHVVAMTPPPVDGSQATTDALGKLYPAEDVVEDEIDLGEGAEDITRALLAARAAHWDTQTLVDTLENELKAQLGSHAIGVTPLGYTLTWKTRTRTSVDSKKLKESYPQIAEQLTKVTEYRVFGIKEPKEESDG